MCSVQPFSSVRIQPAPKTLTPFPPSTSTALSAAVAGGRRVYAPGSRLSTTRANALVPMVIESSPFGERAYDIFSRLLKERIICINGPIGDDTSHVVVAQLLFLESQSDSKPIYMYINSPGGSVTSGLAIYDTMQHINAPVSTICMGQAASMGSVLLAGGAKGQRMSLPHSTIMIHQPLYGYQGQAKDMMIHTKQLQRIWDMLNNIYVKHTGQLLDVIETSTDRDNFMTPEEAKEFGIIDEVITQRPPMGLDAIATGVIGLEQPRGLDSDPKEAAAF